ncbi:MAG: HAD-IIB family hydrolase [Planctomycetia bacterium]|nr:HAD-IIB family hydrolase [Planctomycetia bacterium]
MRYRALACDYDGTVATDGQIDRKTIAALERCRDAGRKLLLVTGRRLEELQDVCPRLDLFESVVGENGALVYRPPTGAMRVLTEPPNEAFVRMLVARGVAPLEVGHAIVATWHPHEEIVLRTIRDLGLELQVVFNKGAVMVLPSGVNKATGLLAALDELGMSPHDVVGVGDAENDHAYLEVCEVAAAVANALPALKQRADLVTVGDHGAGVSELIDMILKNDLAGLKLRPREHQ